MATNRSGTQQWSETYIEYKERLKAMADKIMKEPDTEYPDKVLFIGAIQDYVTYRWNPSMQVYQPIGALSSSNVSSKPELTLI